MVFGELLRYRRGKFPTNHPAAGVGRLLEFAADRGGAGFLALALYLLTPENYLTVRQALPGAIFFSVGWIIVTKLFQFYVAKYDRYNPTYLALASIIMLMTWMYLTCLLLLLGGKLNAILRRERERTVKAAAATPQPA